MNLSYWSHARIRMRERNISGTSMNCRSGKKLRRSWHSIISRYMPEKAISNFPFARADRPAGLVATRMVNTGQLTFRALSSYAHRNDNGFARHEREIP